MIGNDVHVAAQAEMAWGSLQGVSDAIYLNLGSGISAGIICGGSFLKGADGAAGEVGYTLFRGAPRNAWRPTASVRSRLTLAAPALPADSPRKACRHRLQTRSS